MRKLRRYAFDPNQFSLPFERRGRNAIALRVKHDCRLGRQGLAAIHNNKNMFGERAEYKIGVSIICKGAFPVNFDAKDSTVLEILAPHIGHSSALLLELLGYRTLHDLARTGYHLAAIPSIGPKRTEKILVVVESFGFSPPRRPAPAPRHWRALLNHTAGDQ